MKLRPLGREKTDEEKQKRNMIIIGVILIGLMVFSTVGYAIFEGTISESQKTKYKDYEFKTIGSTWQTTLKISGADKTITSYYLPQEVENISVNGTLLLSDFEGKTIYFITNNTNNERNAVSKIYSDFQDYFLRSQLACSIENENTSFCANLPIKSCDDANRDSMIVKIIEVQNATASVNYNSGCLRITGSGADLMRSSDRILFEAYGIIS